MATRRKPSGARVRSPRNAAPPRSTFLAALVRALTTATTEGRIKWVYSETEADWTGTDARVTVAWEMTPKGRAIRHASMVVDALGEHRTASAELDDLAILAPLVRALVTRHQEDVDKIVDGLLADIEGPVETVERERAHVVNDKPYARTVVATSRDDGPIDTTYLTPRTSPAILRESPGIMATIRRWLGRG